MFTLKLLLFLVVGTVAMLVPIMIQTRRYEIDLIKGFLIAIILTIVGTISTYVWFFIEVGTFSGISFFGAVFIVPIVFVLFAKLFGIPYGQIMDICAPAECAMLVIMKVHCFVSGCCDGKLLYITEHGTQVYFPSQIVELTNALVIAVVLLLLSRKKENNGTIYAWYMVLYGSTRFVLNFFRDTKPILLFMGWGSIWGILAILIGVTWLYCNKKIVNKYN